MLAVTVAALVLVAGAPPPAQAQQAHRLIVHALAQAQLGTEKSLFAADAALLEARSILEPYDFGRRPSPLSDVGLAVVADHVALAKTGAGRRAWTRTTIAHTRAALRHLRPYR
jgi:hypothetical protein